MGLLSWIRNKNYGSKHDDYVWRYNNGQVEDAVRGLLEIRDKYELANATLVEIAKDRLKAGDLRLAEKISEQLDDYMFKHGIITVYYDIQWELLKKTKIGKTKIRKLDKLLSHISRNCDKGYLRGVEKKIDDLAESKYVTNNFDEALLLSLCVEKSFPVNCSKRYRDSAYHLYKTNGDVSLIDQSILIKYLGIDKKFLDAAEPFLPFSKNVVNEYASVCEKYIRMGSSVDSSIIGKVKKLIGLHPDAEVLMMYNALNIANDQNVSLTEREKAIREAIDYRKKHNKIFSQDKYDAKIKEITDVANKIATELSSTTFDRATALLDYMRANGFEWYGIYVKIYLGKKYASAEEEFEALNLVAEKGRADGLVQPLRLVNKLDKYHFDKAIELEKGGNFTNALNEYRCVSDRYKSAVDAVGRGMICEMKLGKNLTVERKEEIKKYILGSGSEDIRHDLAFRLCIYLLKNDKLDDAKFINDNSIKDKEIADYYNNRVVQVQLEQFNKISKNLQNLRDGKLSAKQALEFNKNVAQDSDAISAVTDVTKKEIAELKTQIRWYAIKKYFDEGNYLKCIEGLKVQDSTYLSDPVNLRNIAVMCIGAIEDKQITNSNYQEIIAICLTAIYQQLIFVQSLDYTTWDDPYTFTLVDALGSLNSNDPLPFNVNYSSIADAVSIGNVQRALINRVEVALEDNDIYLRFFNKELEAMNRLASLKLREVCVSPYMAQLSNVYRRKITEALHSAAGNRGWGNWEEVLHVGILYGMTGGSFGQYKQAVDYYNSENGRLEKQQKLTCNVDEINRVKHFPRLSTTFISLAVNALNKAIKNNYGYEKVWGLYADFFALWRDENFQYPFANYILNSVFSAMNENKINFGTCAQYLIKIHEVYQSNDRINQLVDSVIPQLVLYFIGEGDLKALDLLIGVLKSTRGYDQAIIDVLSGNPQMNEEMLFAAVIMPNEANFNLLSKRISDKSYSLRSHFNYLNSKLSEVKVAFEMGKIVQGVNNNTISKIYALGQVYDIYVKNMNNAHVCQNLAILVSACIHEYVLAMSPYTKKVQDIVGQLKNNRSSTFKANNSAIKNAYSNFRSQLPQNFDYLTNSQLNDQGKVCRKALDLLKSLF